MTVSLTAVAGWPDQSGLVYVRPGRAAEIMGMSRQTVYALMTAGRLHSLRIGRARLITMKSILALANKGGVPDLDGAIMRKRAAVPAKIAVPVSTEMVPVATKMAVPVSTDVAAQPADAPQLTLPRLPGVHS